MDDRVGRARGDVARRKFLAAVGITGAAALAGCSGKGIGAPVAADEPEDGGETPDATHTSPDLERWVDEVPRPGVIEPNGTKDGQPRYEVEMAEVEQKLHRDLPPTTLWGYGGQFPGPTIEAEQGEPIYVRWQNHLPDEHLLPEDPTIHDDIIPYDEPGARVVPHLHGGNVEHESDGKPQAWFTRDFERTGPDFEKKDYYYANDQPPATLWYHDHSLGITRLNVYAGLAGFYLLRNDHERALDLPTGDNEVPLVLQDRRLPTASNSDRVSGRTSSSTSASTRARRCSCTTTRRRRIAARAASRRTALNPCRRSCSSTWRPRKANGSPRSSRTN